MTAITPDAIQECALDLIDVWAVLAIHHATSLPLRIKAARNAHFDYSSLVLVCKLTKEKEP